MNLLDYFPEGFSPRETQILLLQALQPLLLDTTKKYIVVRAPTGSGKSAICTTISNFFRSQDKKSYLLCSRKYLQTQYLDEYSKVYSNFWGKANYRCPLIAASCSGCPADTAIDAGAYMRFLRFNCTTSKVGDKCPYIVARDQAQIADSSLLNFEAFMANSLSGLWGKRNIMLVDEAHCLADRTVGFFEVKVNSAWAKAPKRSRKDTDNLRVTKDSKELKKVLEMYNSKVSSLQSSKLPVPRDLVNAIKYLNTDGVEWVLDFETSTFIPITLSPLLDKYLFNYTDKVVLLSATLTPNMCKELGLNGSNSTYLEVESTFPKENNKIFTLPSIGKLNRANLAREQTQKKLAEKVLKIRVMHEGRRGLIHTVSYKLVETLHSAIETYLSELSDEDNTYTSEGMGFFFHEKGTNIDQLLEKYKSTKGAVLVTPSLSEGFDGKGDLLEWQIILKCPFPYMGEPRIKELLKTKFGNVLFKERAIATLLQTLGRGIRSKEDRCYTYIFDANITSILSNCSRKSSKHYTSTSKYFKDLWKTREVSKLIS